MRTAIERGMCLKQEIAFRKKKEKAKSVYRDNILLLVPLNYNDY